MKTPITSMRYCASSVLSGAGTLNRRRFSVVKKQELDTLINLDASLAWEFRRPAVNTDTGEEIEDSNVDFGDFWRSVGGECVYGDYWTNLPNHSEEFTEETNTLPGCSQKPGNRNEELEIYIDKPAELEAGKLYYIAVKFYIHEEYLNSNYQFYISKVEYCEKEPIFGQAYFCNVGEFVKQTWKRSANLIEGYIQPAP